ncbi:MAG: protein kinase [Chloroflexota bacterium]
MILNNDGPRYYITRVLKTGGQGAVYETIDDKGDVYAVKELIDRSVDPRERAEAITRFEHEAEILEHLNHPQIPRVHTSFKDEGRYYLAMDFVHGEDLEQLLDREKIMPEDEVFVLAEKICDVLEYLHASGLIYRDMKPSNVMVDRQRNNVKIVDFGITKVLQRSHEHGDYGTPGYAPPEQYQGLTTVESDIYALGATLHHALTGRDPRGEKPFTFPPVRELKPHISPRTAGAIDQALQWQPEDRYRSVVAFRRALLADLTPKPQSQPEPQRKPTAPAIYARPQDSVSSATVVYQEAPPQNASAQSLPLPDQAPSKPKKRRRPIRQRIMGFIHRLISLLVFVIVMGFILSWLFPAQFQTYTPQVISFFQSLFVTYIAPQIQALL